MSIELDDVSSGYNLSVINNNFQKIEDKMNAEVLWRKNSPVAGEAKMERDLDMDGYYILNANLAGVNIVDQRALRIPLSEPAIPPLPVASQRANKLLAFDADGLPIVTIPSSGSAADVLIQLAANDGLKNIGQCPSVAVLRTIEPSSDGQLIFLRSHTAGTNRGGGVFRALLSGAGYTDNNGTVIKTTAGAVWIRQYADIVNPLMFGAVGDGVTNDLTALNNAVASTVSEMDGLGLTYSISGGNITVDGSRFKLIHNFKIVEPAVNNTVMMRINSSNKRVSNVTFDGSVGLTSRGILVAAGLTDITIDYNSFLNLKKPGVGVSGDYTNSLFCQRITIANNYATNCGNDATNYDRNTVILDGAANCSIVNNVFLQCNWGVSFRQPYTYPTLTDPYAFYNKVNGNYIAGKGYTGNPYPENQGISAQSQRHLEISGNTVEGFFGNAIDNQRCDFSRINNNRIGGSSDGIFFGDLLFRGHEVVGNIITSCVRGIRVYGVPSFTNQSMTDLVVTGNTFTDCTNYGIYISNTEPTVSFNSFVVTGNIVESNGTKSVSTFEQSILIEGVTTSNVSNNVVRHARKEGIRFNNCIGINAIGNQVSFFDFSATAQAGIYIDVSSRGVMLRNSLVSSSSGTGAAVRETGTNNTVAGTRWNSVTTGINATGTGVVLSDNVAF